ncbi:PREDICTED: uncharacterized protein LOC105974894 [Erythranthe guttata]|uniref:uncharacterized protein LOC105974894 n=1 Tax=Erythranthe guttata TaxID=4155 RepID=UPI00064DCC69|nr:PREDICTED: uncharacterized protein LOC105974894 [Erythranthe guttata]|eukprot:XP_012855506.1 PREDICTED: uncharacterized protein LOC105974894 [Erythranthe guttata]
MKKIDNSFIQVLAYEARVGNFVVGKDNKESLAMAQNVIEKKHGQFFSTKYMLKKLGILKTRHTTFGWMLSLPGVSYDESTNVVTASDLLWKTMLKEHTFAFAYRTNGDSNWEELQTIFAPPAVEPKSNNNEVIVVSTDDDEENNVGKVPAFNDRRHERTSSPPIPVAQTSVVNISSDSSAVNFNGWDYLTNYSDSEGSLSTKCSTANSKYRRAANGPSPLKPKESLMPRYNHFPNVSSSDSNRPNGKGKGKGSFHGPNAP